MPAIETKLSFDLTNKTADIEYWENGLMISSWGYTEGRIAVAEKPGTWEVDLEEVLRLNEDTRKWVDFISNNFNPAIFPQCQYQLELEKDDSGIKIKVGFYDLVVRDDSWNKDSNKITYGPRPDLDIPWACYYLWRKFGEDFLIAIKNFSKGR